MHVSSERDVKDYFYSIVFVIFSTWIHCKCTSTIKWETTCMGILHISVEINLQLHALFWMNFTKTEARYKTL